MENKPLTISAQKIKHILEYYDFTASHFADSINMQRPSMSHILCGRNQPSIEVMRKILSVYTDINPAWLIVEEEKQMLISNPSYIAPIMYDENEIIENLSQEIKKNDENPIIQPENQKEESENITTDSLISYPSPTNEEKNKTENNQFSFLSTMFSNKNGKKIERIIVFYTDKTIDSYEAN